MTKIVLILAASLLLLVSGCMSPTTTSTPAPTAISKETQVATPIPTAISKETYAATPAPTATPVPAVTSTPTITATLAAITPTINVTSYPASVQGEANFTIKWEVSGGTHGTISNTSILWGFNSGGENITDYPRSSAVQTGQTPRTFSADLKAPAGGGPVYFRAHAAVDGIDVYSPEYSIIIVPLYTGTGGGGGY